MITMMVGDTAVETAVRNAVWPGEAPNGGHYARLSAPARTREGWGLSNRTGTRPAAVALGDLCGGRWSW
ncbi:hypothetical protein FDG2_1890 [Candidatus Protofrankia californiensis]|uniref:Uncharacterized protein n=1 Tax=Candidatus Protofrankia californiensis TaxID=1839754 RepID=A0A1C3NWK8_9ACTN|nr:hypothetical protein FDG2_1890 [Candidatus Protofrankia californiensis]